jgi:hypothetical protein
LVLVGRLGVGGYVDDTIGVDIECSFDLGYAFGSEGDTDKIGVAKELVANKLVLSLVGPDLHSGLTFWWGWWYCN